MPGTLNVLAVFCYSRREFEGIADELSHKVFTLFCGRKIKRNAVSAAIPYEDFCLLNFF